jgi:Xaa-Pro aminopeptidase
MAAGSYRVTPFAPSFFRERRRRLNERLSVLRIPFALITKPVDIFYLTGFRGSAGALLIGPKTTILWVDPRYTLQAHEQARGVHVTETREPLTNTVGTWIRKTRPETLGYQDAHLTCAELALLRRESGRSAGVRWKPLGNLLEELRMAKDPEEVERIRQAGRSTCEAFRKVLPLIEPGAREADLANELEYCMRQQGAEGAAFETIIASGPRSAWPHARASTRRLQRGEFVIIDLGAILAAYAADMTRTIYLGTPTRQARRLYESVAEAQQEAIQSLRPGMDGNEPDAVARRVLARYRLDQYFTHSTGHGVGLEVHERPRLARADRTPIPMNAVVTVEPGVYVEGYGGVRIEDTVLVGEKGPEILTPAAKEPWFTG